MCGEVSEGSLLEHELRRLRRKRRLPEIREYSYICNYLRYRAKEYVIKEFV